VNAPGTVKNGAVIPTTITIPLTVIAKSVMLKIDTFGNPLS
jgi:hypothetical protein